jgi:hypothetical protein
MLCRFARTFPVFVERFLEQSARLSRRFREETITDMFMGGLISISPPNVIVDYPNEARTGADMRWNFVNWDSGTFFSLFIQSKKLYPTGLNWKSHSYKQLFHRTGPSNIYQAEVLCNWARLAPSTFPLYAFYNPQSSCTLARATGGAHIGGVNLASGYEIQRRVSAAKSPAQKKVVRSLGALSPLFFSLRDIFCPGQFVSMGPVARAPGGDPDFSPSFHFDVTGRRMGILLPPRPEDVRIRLIEALNRSIENGSGTKFEVPGVSSIPREIRARIESRDASFSADERRSHWTITLISRNAPDEE